MQNALYIFLKRRWEQDESYLNTVLSYFVDSSACLQLLLFPEGTNLEEGSKIKSDSFAEKITFHVMIMYCILVSVDSLIALKNFVKVD